MRKLNKRAVSIIEYIVLLIIIISAFLIMRNYMQRGIYGIWAKTGQSFAYGRQYDAEKTIECDFDPPTNSWYDRNCAEAQCPDRSVSCLHGAVSGCQTVTCNSAGQ